MTSNASTYANRMASSGFVWMFSDTWEIIKRNLIRSTRQPQLLATSTAMPVMMVVMFVYVLGGAIKIPGMDYVNYIIPGIIIQAILFGSMQTAVGLSEDMNKGLIDRFRSLPMARSAVLAGRTIADLIRNVFVIGLMIAIAYLIGFQVQTNVGLALVAVVVALAFSFAVMWIMATIGMLTKSAETSQTLGMLISFPLVFVSSAFVPVDSMPGWLQAFAEISPVTVCVDAVRGLLVTGEYATALWQAALWIGGILIVFIPLAVNRYLRVS